ncbi:MAG: CRTAC1 family protein, partial [Terriglobales bacterium]
GKFSNALAHQGGDLARPVVARGAAYGDFDLDGFPDVLVTTNNGPAYLYHNSGNGNHALRLKLVGQKSNRDGIGALIRLRTPAGWQQQYVKSGSSYCSSSELPVTFGLGPAGAADQVEIHWPSGQIEQLSNVPDGFITVTEGAGITSRRAFTKH